jgi:hypothetical protein
MFAVAITPVIPAVPALVLGARGVAMCVPIEDTIVDSVATTTGSTVALFRFESDVVVVILMEALVAVIALMTVLDIEDEVITVGLIFSF